MNPTDFKYLFLDMNSFFASVEQQDRLELRGKPVAVTPYTGPTGCVIAASYEAKGRGVKVGDRVGEAKEKIPSIAVVEARPRRYLQIHGQIKRALEPFSPWVEPYSIDEFSLLIDARERREEVIHRLGQDIKLAIKKRVGEHLRCSVGIGPNIFLSKLGTDLRKPDGFVVMRLHRLENIFAAIADLTTLCGISYGLSARLRSAGISTPLQLWRCDPMRLRRVFGVAGERWYRDLHGFDSNLPQDLPKSVGHSYVLEPSLRNHGRARQVIHKLASKVAIRLRQKNLVAEEIYVGVRALSGGGQFSHQRLEPTNKTVDITRVVLRLFDRCPAEKPLLLSVTATRLGFCPHRQLSIFDRDDRLGSIETAVDNINQRFGPETVVSADLTHASRIAPYRIAFNALDEPVTKQ